MTSTAWWPDWSGETALIAASGPSLDAADIVLARDRARVVAINNTWTLCPWADLLYGCDVAWWEREGEGYGREARRGFHGLMISGQQVSGLRQAAPAKINELFGGENDLLCSNSALQAAKLIALWGVRRIVLTGCDCRGPGAHWHGRHPLALGQSKAHTLARWRKGFAAAAPVFIARGVEIINASRESALDCFPRATMPEALA